ncbi:MAG: metalloprotease [Halodesulfurarchaeum sp.]
MSVRSTTRQGSFSRREIRDLLVAWAALGVAFTFFFARVRPATISNYLVSSAFFLGLLVNLGTVGVGFLLHELAHKAVATRYGQYAEFRAAYQMLALAVAGGLAGFIFAAPGAVYHRGQLSDARHGHVALAGPVTNLALAGLFVPVTAIAPMIGSRGVEINLLLAAFNMLPVGGLDGQTVRQWSTPVFLLVFVPSVALALWMFFA